MNALALKAFPKNKIKKTATFHWILKTLLQMAVDYGSWCPIFLKGTRLGRIQISEAWEMRRIQGGCQATTRTSLVLQRLATARSFLLYPESIPGSGLGREASGCPHEREHPWGRGRQDFQWWRWNIQGWRWRQAFMDRWWIKNKGQGIMGPWLISADPKGTTISWLVL